MSETRVAIAGNTPIPQKRTIGDLALIDEASGNVSHHKLTIHLMDGGFVQVEGNVRRLGEDCWIGSCCLPSSQKLEAGNEKIGGKNSWKIYR